MGLIEVQMGMLDTIIKRLNKYAKLPLWLAFRSTVKAKSSGKTSDQQCVQHVLEQKESHLRQLLFSGQVNSFLEVGIGELPNVERVKLMIKNNVQYTGCDFKSVCKSHLTNLAANGVDSDKIVFAGNEVGTYSWTLFEMVKEKRQFDVIYIDGHHTFYVDLPAFFLADLLLRPEGILIIDDILWTCDFLKETMASSFVDWNFYRKIYDLSIYDHKQQNIPHMKMIADEILINQLKYSKLPEYCIPEWWVLQKKGSNDVLFDLS